MSSYRDKSDRSWEKWKDTSAPVRGAIGHSVSSWAVTEDTVKSVRATCHRWLVAINTAHEDSEDHESFPLSESLQVRSQIEMYWIIVD